MRTVVLVLLLAARVHAEEKEAKWTDLKGQIILDPNFVIPKPRQINLNGVPLRLLLPPVMFEETLVIERETRGLANVFVWIEPTANRERGMAFPKEKVHPDLRELAIEDVSISLVAGQFAGGPVGIREGQNLVFLNPNAAAFKLSLNSEKVSKTDQIAAMGKQVYKNIVAEKFPLMIDCDWRPEMKIQLRSFDHPYFAVTDKLGRFEIPRAPQGEYRLYSWHSLTGWNGGRSGRNGTPIKIEGKSLDLKAITYSMK
jgi:hypothetical protein